jgi:sec-independent protein translocase protein TatA
MFGLGFGELVLVFLIALIFIGPKKLPELAKGLGKGIREFQDAAKGMKDQIEQSIEEDKKASPKVETIAQHPINEAPVVTHAEQKTDSSTENKA